jgi:hypothetical protein
MSTSQLSPIRRRTASLDSPTINPRKGTRRSDAATCSTTACPTQLAYALCIIGDASLGVCENFRGSVWRRQWYVAANRIELSYCFLLEHTPAAAKYECTGRLVLPGDGGGRRGTRSCQGHALLQPMASPCCHVGALLARMPREPRCFLLPYGLDTDFVDPGTLIRSFHVRFAISVASPDL